MDKFIQLISVLQYLALIVSAAWIYRLYLIRREGEPGGELEINVDFVGKQNAKWLIEVSAILTNKSFVRHKYENFQVVVRFLKPEDIIEDRIPDHNKKPTNYQINCPRTIDERIDGKKRYFSNAEYINPRLSFRHSYITFVPEEATFIWVQCKLQFYTKPHWLAWKNNKEKKNAQKLFKVPREESGKDVMSIENTSPE